MLTADRHLILAVLVPDLLLMLGINLLLRSRYLVFLERRGANLLLLAAEVVVVWGGRRLGLERGSSLFKVFSMLFTDRV